MSVPRDAENEDDVTASVCLIQRVYRGYRTRRELQGRQLTSRNRWIDTVREAQGQQHLRSSTPPASSPGVQAQRNWKHAVSIAKLARGDSNREAPSPRCPTPSPPTTSKAMDLQYFLEMMDPKHRHGSNLRKYHEYWKTADSPENFFYWLDYGAGKDVELPACPRDQLEREQVRYLSREERINYLVKVDDMGRFRWAKNNQLVWTNNARYQDSGEGIIAIRDLSLADNENHKSIKPPTRSTSTSLQDDYPQGMTNTSTTPEKGPKSLRDRKSQIMNRIKDKLFSSEDWWIFVADPSYRLYIGIKKRGSFQHSSFLRGGRIAAAGLLKIRHGKLRDLAPLSGHYRPHSSNFHAFVHALRDQGADLSRVSTTKLYATLAGMEGYVGTKRKVIKAREKIGHRIKNVGREDPRLTVDW